MDQVNNNGGEEITPARKRKADGDTETGKKSENKKLKPTYTPRTPAGRQCRKTTMAEKKDTRPVAMHELKDCLGDMTKKLTETLTKSLTAGLTKDFTEAVSVVAGSVATNTKNIDAINGTIKRLESESNLSADRLEKKIEKLESVFLAARNGNNHNQGQNQSQNHKQNGPQFDLLQVDMRVREENFMKSERYAVSRRSLRLWPIGGSSDEEIRAGAIRFLREKMRIDRADLQDEQIYRVRRSKQPRNSRVKWEVIVTFDDKFARDTVSAHGRNLSDFINDQGQPTAGTRLDYPSHLGTTFRTLDWYGKEMRERHGRGTKRNMRFDDDEETLVLDVCLPEDECWHRVTFDEARRYKLEVDQERMARTRRTLEGPGGEPRRPRGEGGPSEGGRRVTGNEYVSPVRRT